MNTNRAKWKSSPRRTKNLNSHYGLMPEKCQATMPQKSEIYLNFNADENNHEFENFLDS